VKLGLRCGARSPTVIGMHQVESTLAAWKALHDQTAEVMEKLRQANEAGDLAKAEDCRKEAARLTAECEAALAAVHAALANRLKP
jgi:hypothetical protein